MFEAAIPGPEDSTQYLDSSDTITVYKQGSRSWRTQNPGLIGYGMHAFEHGAIGNAHGVAIFQDQASGQRALMALLGSRDYRMFTVEEAMKRFVPGYDISTSPDADPTMAPASGSRTDPKTGLQADLTLDAIGADGHNRMAAAITRELGWQEGVITRESKDGGGLNQAKRGSGTNVIINGRSAVHAGSQGTLITPDVCKTPKGKSCPPVLYANVAQSRDAARTASSVLINGHPACHESSTFSRSSGDEGGRCGGVRSGTTKGKAEFITSSGNVFVEGKAAVRQFDLMVSNNQNTPPAPLMQVGGARGEVLAVTEVQGLASTEGPYAVAVEVIGAELSFLKGRICCMEGER